MHEGPAGQGRPVASWRTQVVGCALSSLGWMRRLDAAVEVEVEVEGAEGAEGEVEGAAERDSVGRTMPEGGGR